MAKDDDTINSNEASNPLGAWLNAKERSETAFSEHEEFFTDPEHVKLVETIFDIVSNWFIERESIYINCRSGQNNPFTAIKVHRPSWPTKRSKAEAQKLYYGPLQQLGIKEKRTGTNGYIYHIY